LKVPNCGEESTCVRLELSTGEKWISGQYCPVGESQGQPVYNKVAETIPDTLYLAKYNIARDGDFCTTHTRTGPPGYVIKQAAPGEDFKDPDPKSGEIELKGDVVKCIGGPTDFMRKVFLDGKDTYNFGQGKSITAYISGRPCGKPNITMSTQAQADEEEEEEEFVEVSTLVFDDTGTTQIEDYWLHPCDCFPENYGAKPPVTEDALEAVPPNTNNLFIPAAVLIIDGEFSCEMDSTMTVKMISVDNAASDASCAEECIKASTCRFFIEATVQGNPTCRTYTKCDYLVRELGLEGGLMAMHRTGKKVCHIADAVGCWKVSGRRAYLNGHAVLRTVQASCIWMDQAKQCDHKLLLGGLGVSSCGPCNYKDDRSFSGKLPLPEAFSHGETLGISCWRERFVPLAVVGNKSKMKESLTCVGGDWLDSDGNPGLSNFACGSCMVVAKPSYIQWDLRKKQELYFLTKLQQQIWVKARRSAVLTSSGSFLVTEATTADNTMVELFAVNDYYQLKSGDKCLNSSRVSAKDPVTEIVTHLTVLTSATCVNTTVAQLFMVGDIPPILKDIITDDFQAMLSTPFDKNSTKIFAWGFFALEFVMDCSDFAVGSLMWKTGDVNKKKFWLNSQCRTAANFGPNGCKVDGIMTDGCKTDGNFPPPSASRPPGMSCAADLEILNDDDGRNYGGCQTHTAKDIACQKWTAQTPNKLSYVVESDSSSQTAEGLGDHSFCRNPGKAGTFTTDSYDGNIGDVRESTIWCYTRTPGVWGTCLVLPAVTPNTQTVRACRNGSPTSRSSKSCFDRVSHIANNKLVAATYTQAVLDNCGINAFDNIPANYWYTDNVNDCSKVAPSLEVKIARALAGVVIMCGDGQAITWLKKLASGFKYKCAAIAGIAKCGPFFSVQSDIRNVKPNSPNFLVDVSVECGVSEVLRMMQGERS